MMPPGPGRCQGAVQYSPCEYSHYGYNSRMTPSARDVAAFLPLPPVTFHILVALAGTDRHGYAVIQEVAERTGGAVRLSAGTLYRSIQRMLEQGLIAETTTRPAPELDDERRRYYRLTPLGLAVMRAETGRLSDLVRMAQATGLVTRRA
jgi:DNA-binding PadR family transcriptional regulator